MINKKRGDKNEIRFTYCNKEFTIDDVSYFDIVNQVKIMS